MVNANKSVIYTNTFADELLIFRKDKKRDDSYKKGMVQFSRQEGPSKTPRINTDKSSYHKQFCAGAWTPGDMAIIQGRII